MKSLTVLALALCAGLLLAFPAPAQQTEDHFQRSFAVQSGATLLVDNHKGLIRVTGSDASQVVVNVLKKFEGAGKDRAWWMSNTQVHFTNSSDRVEVSVEYPNSNGSILDWESHEEYQAAVELTIQVPRNINLDLRGHKPEMNIAAINGDIQISSYKSPIKVRSATGAIHIKTYKETVQLKDVSIHGALDIQMAKGDASIEARSLGESVNLETQKGTIVLKAPQNAGMTVDYSGGRRSSFHSDFNIAAEGGSSSSVRGAINGGGTQVRLRSEKGSVSLERL